VEGGIVDSRVALISLCLVLLQSGTTLLDEALRTGDVHIVEAVRAAAEATSKLG
jgi:hypothetical protein